MGSAYLPKKKPIIDEPFASDLLDAMRRYIETTDALGKYRPSSLSLCARFVSASPFPDQYGILEKLVTDASKKQDDVVRLIKRAADDDLDELAALLVGTICSEYDKMKVV